MLCILLNIHEFFLHLPPAVLQYQALNKFLKLINHPLIKI